MDSVVSFVTAHQVLVTLAGGYVWSSFISALPSPQAASSPFYVFCFKFLNVLAANISRAQNSAVENSPNFQAAVNAMPGPVNKPVVVVEAPKKD